MEKLPLLLPLLTYVVLIVIPSITYAFQKDFQKYTDKNVIKLSNYLKDKESLSFFKKYANELYTLSINSFVASALLLLNYTSAWKMVIMFLCIVFLWFFSLLFKIDFDKENLDNYTNDFFIALSVGLLFLTWTESNYFFGFLFMIISGFALYKIYYEHSKEKKGLKN